MGDCIDRYHQTFAQQCLPGHHFPYACYLRQASGNKVMIYDTPDAGGSTMSSLLITAQDIKDGITNDELLSQEWRCELYATNFLITYQSIDFWNPDEYRAMGCTGVDPYSFDK